MKLQKGVSEGEENRTKVKRSIEFYRVEFVETIRTKLHYVL